MDGVGRWGSFVRSFLPLAAPAIATSWLPCLTFIWNERMNASGLGYIEARSFTILIHATGSGGGVNFGAATTRALAATAVPVIAEILAQRYKVRARSLDAVKSENATRTCLATTAGSPTLGVQTLRRDAVRTSSTM